MTDFLHIAYKPWEISLAHQRRKIIIIKLCWSRKMAFSVALSLNARCLKWTSKAVKKAQKTTKSNYVKKMNKNRQFSLNFYSRENRSIGFFMRSFHNSNLNILNVQAIAILSLVCHFTSLWWLFCNHTKLWFGSFLVTSSFYALVLCIGASFPEKRNHNSLILERFYSISLHFDFQWKHSNWINLVAQLKFCIEKLLRRKSKI